MAVTDRVDPYLSFRFLVEINGLTVGGFSEVGGLDLEVEVHRFREGGHNDFEHQLPGPARHPTQLSLKRGMVDSDGFFQWCLEASKGRFTRRDVAVLLLDSAGDEQRRWVFYAACPVKWSGPRFAAGTAEVAVETVELIYRDMQSR